MQRTEVTRLGTACRTGDRVGPIVSRRWRWKRLALALVKFNDLLHDPTKFDKHGLFVLAVASTVKQSRTTPHKTAVFFRPFDNLDVPCGLIHDLDSSIARLTARCWYYFASSPGLPESVTGFATLECTKFRWLPLPPRSKNPADSKSATAKVDQIYEICQLARPDEG